MWRVKQFAYQSPYFSLILSCTSWANVATCPTPSSSTSAPFQQKCCERAARESVSQATLSTRAVALVTCALLSLDETPSQKKENHGRSSSVARAEGDGGDGDWVRIGINGAACGLKVVLAEETDDEGE